MDFPSQRYFCSETVRCLSWTGYRGEILKGYSLFLSWVIFPNRNSAIADMAAPCCAIGFFFAVECGDYLSITYSFPEISENITIYHTLPKSRFFWTLHLCRRLYGSNFKVQPQHCDVIGPKFSEFGEITQNNGHFTVHGRSRSPISVPMESPYETSCTSIIVAHLLSRFRDMMD